MYRVKRFLLPQAGQVCRDAGPLYFSNVNVKGVISERAKMRYNDCKNRGPEHL
jgi:hypothetical protein